MSQPTIHRVAASLVSGFALMVTASRVASTQEPPQPPSAVRQVSTRDVTKPVGKTRTIDFVTTEGTNMSVDVTPDGQWVVFDLLSHIYRVPMIGGEAEVLTQGSGIALNYQPRVSPDGKSIAFISDRSGQANLWIMEIDGKNQRPVFQSLGTALVEPVWTADGEFIMARGGGAIRKYPKTGGAGIEVLRSGSNAVASPDGKYLYFQASENTETRPGVGTRDLLMGASQIRRHTLAGGETFAVTSGTDQQNGGRNSSGGGIAPEISPDGRWLSFARRNPTGTFSYKGKKLGPRNTLWLHDLQTGAERMVMDPIEMDAAEGVKTLRSMPGYRWTSDGKYIVLAQGGQIRKLEVATGKATAIPFRARVHREISEQAIPVTRISDEPFQAKYLLWHTASPDGSKLAFQAAGRLYVQDLPNGKPRRLTPITFKPLEYAPAWSPDGQWLVFVSWDGIEPGQIWKVSANGGAPVRITREAGEYIHPSWNADGNEILATRGSGVTFQGRPLSGNPWYEFVRVPASGGAATSILRVLPFSGREQLPRATYGLEGRIFYVTASADSSAGGRGGRGGGGGGAGGGGAQSRELVSVKPDGSDKRVHAVFPYTDDAVPSPDGRWVAYNEGDNIFVVAMPVAQAGQRPATLDRRKDSTNIKMFGTTGGLYPRWRDATTVEFGSANVYSAYSVTGERKNSITVDLRIPKSIPQGTIALTNARIITMKGREVIPRGHIVITNGRIKCVGPCATAGANRVVDLTGKTVFPGWVDMHAHRTSYEEGLIAPRNFEAASALAYGITTDHDPSTWSQAVFATAEMTEAGEVIGPRTYSTGESVNTGTGARGNPMETYEDLEHIAAKLKSWGAVSLKQHPLPRRDQRQWWAEAGRKLGMMVTGEGADLDQDLSYIMDGQTGWEHLLSYTPIYSDVARFIGAAHAFYSSTMVGAGPGIWSEEFFYQERDLWKDAKLRRWEPWQYLVPHTRRRTMRPVTDYNFPMVSQGVADIVAAGGYGPMGQHSRQNALSAHWEVRMLAEGLGAHGALETASMHGAMFLGAQRDIGSLEVGKLADLIVTNSNPLVDIRNTADMRYVMKGGVLYDSDTLDELWPRQRKFGPVPWYNPDVYRDDDRPTTYWDRRNRTP